MSRPLSQSYLLRLWRERPSAPVRATIIAVGQPQAQRHFADLEGLCAFLHAQADQEAGLSDAWDTTYCTRSEIS